MYSKIYRGVWEHGRRYQTTSDKDISFPSDDKQFESMEAGHAAHTIIEAMQENPFFRAPISESAQNVLDVGTGQGAWAIDVADRFPHRMFPIPSRLTKSDAHSKSLSPVLTSTRHRKPGYHQTAILKLTMLRKIGRGTRSLILCI